MEAKIHHSKKIRIALVSLYNPFSFSVRGLHSVLKDIESCEVYSIFFNHSNERKEIKIAIKDKCFHPLLKIISEINPDLIGISVNSCFLKIAERMTEKLKTNFKSYIIWGGIYPTLHPDESLKYCDIVCLGEGEDTLKELVLKLSQRRNIYNIQGLWFKDNGRIIKNDIRPLIEDLDRLPYQDISDSNKYYIYGNKIYPNIPFYKTSHRLSYNIMGMRNCPYNCNFCSHHVVRKRYEGRSYVRIRSVENIIRELITAKEYKKSLQYIEFFDDNFTLDKEWINQFCLEYKRFIHLPFSCFTHPKTIDEEVILKLKNTGVHALCIGIQASPKCSREIFDRPYSEKEVLKITYMLRKYNIRVVYDIINNNPFENHTEFFDFLSRIPKPYTFNTHDLNFFKGYKITDLALKRALITEHDIVENQERVIKWDMFLIPVKNKDQLIWECLYYLIQKRFIQNSVLRLLVRYKFFRKGLIFLVPICILAYNIEGYCRLILKYTKDLLYLIFRKNKKIADKRPILLEKKYVKLEI